MSLCDKVKKMLYVKIGLLKYIWLGKNMSEIQVIPLEISLYNNA